MAPYVWVEQIERDLEAGAWKVIAEARESGTAGIYRADGEVRTRPDRRDRARDRRGAADLRGAPPRPAGVAAEALRHASATSATSRPDDVLSLETLRLGLRSDTVERFARAAT